MTTQVKALENHRLWYEYAKRAVRDFPKDQWYKDAYQDVYKDFEECATLSFDDWWAKFNHKFKKFDPIQVFDSVEMMQMWQDDIHDNDLIIGVIDLNISEKAIIENLRRILKERGFKDKGRVIERGDMRPASDYDLEKKTQSVDIEKYLKVYDLKKEGMTHLEIARIIFPETIKKGRHKASRLENSTEQSLISDISVMLGKANEIMEYLLVGEFPNYTA